MPTERFAYTTDTGSPPGRVWEGLQDPETWAAVGGVDQVFDAAFDHAGLAGYRFYATAGGRRHEGRAHRLAHNRPREMAMEIETPELSGVIDITIEPMGDGSRLHVELVIKSRGFFSTMFFPVIAAAIGTGLGRNVEAFLARLG
jgi:carbon monoxide dehydrogenase subunit G